MIKADDNSALVDDVIAFGGSGEQVQERTFLVEPENELSIKVYLAVSTQWRISPAGNPTGLDYTALAHVFDWLDVAKKHRGRIFKDIQSMESKSIEIMRSASQPRGTHDPLHPRVNRPVRKIPSRRR